MTAFLALCLMNLSILAVFAVALGVGAAWLKLWDWIRRADDNLAPIDTEQDRADYLRLLARQQNLIQQHLAARPELAGCQCRGCIRAAIHYDTARTEIAQLEAAWAVSLIQEEGGR